MTAVPDAVRRRRKLGALLTCLFLLAMVMGSGPGLRLVNPDPGDAATAFTLWGLPKLYVWGLLWYAAQLAVIVVAYFKVWRPSKNGVPLDSANLADHLIEADRG